MLIYTKYFYNSHPSFETKNKELDRKYNGNEMKRWYKCCNFLKIIF